MKTIFLFAVGIFVLCFSSSIAQTVPERSPDSRDILLKGIELYDKGEHKEAASLFGTVHRNDTSYMLSLYEKALALQRDSLYEEALANIELLLVGLFHHVGSQLAGI